MGSPNAFFPRVTDRTPYGACSLVAIGAVIVLICGIIGLWKAGMYFKRSPQLPGLDAAASPVTSGSDYLEQAKQKAQSVTNSTTQKPQEQAQSALSSEQQKAQDAAQKAAENAIQQQVDQVKNTLTTTATPKP